MRETLKFTQSLTHFHILKKLSHADTVDYELTERTYDTPVSSLGI